MTGAAAAAYGLGVMGDQCEASLLVTRPVGRRDAHGED